MNDAALLIECLLDFARRRELVSPLDVYVSRNALLDLFGLAEPWAGEVPPQTAQTPAAILDGLLDAAAAGGQVSGKSVEQVAVELAQAIDRYLDS